LRCGSGQIPCESSEHKSGGELLGHISSYRDRPKDSVGHIKRWWIRRNCEPFSTQTAQLDKKDIVIKIKKVEILVHIAFLCCVSKQALDN